MSGDPHIDRSEDRIDTFVTALRDVFESRALAVAENQVACADHDEVIRQTWRQIVDRLNGRPAARG